MPETTAETKYLTITEATKAVPGRPHVSTIWRWMKKGASSARGRVKLTYYRVGGRIYTTPADIDAFVARLTEIDQAESPEAETVAPEVRDDRRRERDIEAAERRLAASGC